MSAPLSWIESALNELESQGLYRRRRVASLLPDGRCSIDSRTVLDFASNDYLNLATDPRVIAGAINALQTCTVGSRASPLVCGRTPWHVSLEETLARFEGEDQALLYPTGMAANSGTIAALCGPDDLILCDRLNHASLVDGCRLSGARLRVYRHDDLDAIGREMTKSSTCNRRWIVTDAIFSMDGDIAPLQDLCDIAERFDASLIVDEAHGTGVLGEHGRGACEALGVESRIAVRIGTLSKAVGTQGGFVAGDQTLIDFLWNRARSQVYSTALSPVVCAAAKAAIEFIMAEPWRRIRLAEASSLFRLHLKQANVETVAAATGPIVPVLLNDPQAAVSVATRLEERGFLVGAIRPPTVPRGTSRLRIVVTAAHSDEDLARLALAVGEEVAGFRVLSHLCDSDRRSP